MYNMEKQHKLGKLHALERICLLLDEDSFREIGSNITNLEDAFNIKKGQFPYDGVITGYGTIGGKKVVIYSEDFMSRPTANLRFFSTIFIYRDFVFMDLANGCGSGRMFFVKMYGVVLSPAMPMP